MTSDRAYRKGMSKELAVEELKRCAGTQFDAEVVETLTTIITELRRQSAAIRPLTH
jgi:HD-GYP domain-containing protein (c-di-GMP phosphodiesterase class II)